MHGKCVQNACGIRSMHTSPTELALIKEFDGLCTTSYLPLGHLVASLRRQVLAGLQRQSAGLASCRCCVRSDLRRGVWF